MHSKVSYDLQEKQSSFPPNDRWGCHLRAICNTMDTHNIDICPIERYGYEKCARYKPNLWRGNARIKPYARYYPPLPYGKPELALMNAIHHCSRKLQIICSIQCRSYREYHMTMWPDTLKSQSNRVRYISVEFTYRYHQWGQIWVWILFPNPNTGETRKPVNNFCFYAMKYIAHISDIIDDNRVCCGSDRQVK